MEERANWSDEKLKSNEDQFKLELSSLTRELADLNLKVQQKEFLIEEQK